MPSVSGVRKARSVKLGSAASSKRSVKDDPVSLEQLWTYREVLRYSKPSYSNSTTTGTRAGTINIDLKAALQHQPLRIPNRTNTPTPRRWQSQGSLDLSSDCSQGLKGYTYKPVFLDDCKVEKRRQESYESFMKMPTTVHISRKMAVASDSDNKLPVVELKPFITSTKKEWRPSKSWADSLEFDEPSNGLLLSRYQQPFSANSDGTKPAIQHQTSQEFLPPQAYYDQMGYPAPNKLTPRVPEGICIKAFPVAAERIGLHPKHKDIPDGSGSNRESFVTKLEREKSTTEEIRFGSNSNVPTSFFQRSLTEIDLHTQTDMRVKGKRYRKMPDKKADIYYEPWQIYKKNRAKIPSEHQQNNINKLKARVESIENGSLDRNIYDYFDRTTTLPALTVKSANAKGRRAGRSKSLYIRSPEPGRRSTTPSRSHSGSGYRLGVVNSLDVMSMCGRPLSIEQSLTKSLKSTIEQLKRTKDAGFLEYVNPTITKRLPPNPKIDMIGAPTIGEMMISQARLSNAPSTISRCTSKRSGMAKSAHSQRDAFFSRATTYWPDSGFDSNTADARTVSPSKSMKSAHFVKLSQHPGNISPDLESKPPSTGKMSRTSSAGGAPQVPNSSARSTSRFPVPPQTPAAAMKQRNDTSSIGDSVDMENSSRFQQREPTDVSNEPNTTIPTSNSKTKATDGVESEADTAPKSPVMSKLDTTDTTVEIPSNESNKNKENPRANDETSKDTVPEQCKDIGNVDQSNIDDITEKQSVHSIEVVIPQENIEKPTDSLEPEQPSNNNKEPENQTTEPAQEKPSSNTETPEEEKKANISPQDGVVKDNSVEKDTEPEMKKNEEENPVITQESEGIVTLAELGERNKVLERRNYVDSGAALESEKSEIAF